MATDPFQNTSLSLDSPAESAAPVTPNDTTDLAVATRSLFVGTPGDVTVHMLGQSTPVTFPNLPVCLLPIRVDRVLSTGTSASDIIALW